MKVGDLVMFVDEGTYAQWFYGALGLVEAATRDHLRGRCVVHLRVRWCHKVTCHGRVGPTISHFKADKFKVLSANR